MNESDAFLKNMVSNVSSKKNISTTDEMQNEYQKIRGAEYESNKKTNIFDELIAESKSDIDLKKIALMSHVDPDVYAKVMTLCKKTGRSRSRVINDILKKALMD